jgi:lipoprotein-releasing system permease protein
MNLKLIFNISVTLLRARMKQSVVAAAGVTFGIGMFITLMSFMTGLNNMLDSLILNRTPHIRLFNAVNAAAYQPIDLHPDFDRSLNLVRSVKPADSRMEIYNSIPIINALKSDKRVMAVAPKVSAQVFYNTGVIDINGVVNGIDVDTELDYFFLNDYIISGDARDLDKVANSIVLGKGVADKMMTSVGEIIQITSARGDQVSLKVVGIFQQGLAQIDDINSYASLSTTQKILGKTESYFTDIQIKLHDLNQAPAMAKELSRLYDVDAEDVQTANAQFESGTNVRNTITFAVSIALLIVAGFGIYNILNMMIYEKMDSIAILKATGFSGKDVSAIFIYLSLIIGIFGGLIGLIVGLGLSFTIDNIPFETAALPAIHTFPVNYNPLYYLIGILFALITTFIAGLFPAQKAGKIDPVIIIRGK